MGLFGSADDQTAFELPEGLGQRVDELLARDDEIGAVKLVRQETGAGLLVASRAVNRRKELRDSE